MAAVDLQRTPDELKNPDFNYYIAFKIDLNETDKAKIEPIIKKALSNTGGSLTIRRLIELKNDIIQIMCNDAVFDGTKLSTEFGGTKERSRSSEEI